MELESTYIEFFRPMLGSLFQNLEQKSLSDFLNEK